MSGGRRVMETPRRWRWYLRCAGYTRLSPSNTLLVTVALQTALGGWRSAGGRRGGHLGCLAFGLDNAAHLRVHARAQAHEHRHRTPARPHSRVQSPLPRTRAFEALSLDRQRRLAGVQSRCGRRSQNAGTNDDSAQSTGESVGMSVAQGGRRHRERDVRA